MYKNLHTNLPKEVMGFKDFPIQNSIQSYISSDIFLEYLHLYAERFNLNPLIKFCHHVIRVRPTEDSKWELIVKDLNADSTITREFDAIFVCNGHSSVANWPKYKGMDRFKGKQWHSHYYRKPDPFTGKNILIIGGGPSGVDLTYALSEVAAHITFSYNSHNVNHRFSTNVTMKGNVKEITEFGVIFDDGTEESFTDILYCTGYQTKLPFLSADCGVYVDENFVQPLYKHCVNINYPTMALIGLPSQAAITQMIDIQVRFCMAFLNGHKHWPTKEEMIKDTNDEMLRRWNRGFQKKQAHSLGPFGREYYTQLATTAGIDNVPEVFMKIYDDSHQRRMEMPAEYRNDTYRIIDDEHFEIGFSPKNVEVMSQKQNAQ